MLVAPPTGTTLTIKRDVDLTQGTDYVENDSFPAESHEKALDKLTMISQQMQEEIDRSIKFAESEDTASPSLPALQALKFLRIKSDSSGIELVDGTTSSVASDVNYTQGGLGSVLRNVEVRLQERVSVKDFGAKGDGTTDDTAAIQAAIDYAESIGGATLFIPTGTYIVSSTLTVDSDGVRILGAGMWNTIISRSGDYGDTFFFTGNDTTGAVLLYVGISHLSIYSTGLTTSGAHIHGNGVARYEESDIFMQDGFIGRQMDGVSAAYSDRTYLVFTSIFGGSVVGRAYAKFGAAAAAYPSSRSGDFFISDFNWRGNTANNRVEYGIEITTSDGLWFSNGHLGNTTIANTLLNSSNATEVVGLVFFDNVMHDANLGAGIQFIGSASRGSGISFNECNLKGGGTGTIGIETSVDADFYGVTFTDCTIWQYTLDGVAIKSPDFNGAFFNGCPVRGNSFGASGVSSGYTLTNASNVTITGGNSGGNDVNPAAAGQQKYGINFSGTCSDILITGVNLKDNVTDSINTGAGAFTEFYRAFGCLTDDLTTIVSASLLFLPVTGEVFTVNLGTANIATLENGFNGRRITLIMNGIINVNENGNVNLAGAVAFNGTPTDTLTLVHDGTSWYETGRSVN